MRSYFLFAIAAIILIGGIQIIRMWRSSDTDLEIRKRRPKPFRKIKRKYVNVKPEDYTDVTIDDLFNYKHFNHE